MNIIDAIFNTRQDVCSRCGNVEYICKIENNTECYDCLTFGINRNSSVRYKKQPIPQSIRDLIFHRDGYACKSCGSKINLAVDHIKAESKGGKTEISNLQTLCKKCNSIKGAK